MQPDNLKPVVAQENVAGVAGTDLDLVIADIPWGAAFTIGAGVDAVTGGVMASAIKPVDLTPATTQTSNERVALIKSESEMNSEIDGSLTGKFNIEGIPVDGSASYLAQVRYSARSITLVARYVCQPDAYDESGQYELTDDAKKLMETPAAFRDAYGDYFVAGGRRASRFTAVFTCQAASSSSMQQFAGKLDAKVDLFSADGSAKFSAAASANKITVDVGVIMEGYEGNPPDQGSWTPASVQTTLQWFKANAKGSYLQAKLKHYKTVISSYPRSVDVEPSVFVDLRSLYTGLCSLRIRYHSLPPNSQDTFQRQFTALDHGVVADQGDLARNATERNAYLDQLNSLVPDLKAVLDRVDFIQQVQAVQEPAQEVAVSEGTNQQSWMYGFKAYPQSAAVAIQATPFEYKGAGTTLGWESHVFEYKGDGKSLIVGWEVTSNYRDGSNGSWQKGIKQILLTDYAAVTVQADFNRCLNWGFTVYTVSAADYKFE